MTAALFLGGFGKNPRIPVFGSKPAWWQIKLNKLMMLRALGNDYKKRDNKISDLTDDEIHNGDFLAIDRFDGVAQIIQLGSGGIGHSAVVLEIDGSKYVVESTSSSNWPNQGI